MDISFEPTITLSAIITAASVIFGFIGFVYSLKGDLRGLAASHNALGERLGLVEKRMGDVTDVLRQVAQQEVRLNYHEQRISELAHGEGRVLPLFKSPHEY